MKELACVLILLMSCVFYTSAENVSREQALNVATRFFNNARTSGVAHQTSVSSLEMILSSASLPNAVATEAPAFYVFGNTSGRRFVIVSGEDATAPILGYSFENDFPEGNIPPGLLNLLEGFTIPDLVIDQTYDWEDMPLEFNSDVTSSDPGIQKVAELIYHCGCQHRQTILHKEQVPLQCPWQKL